LPARIAGAPIAAYFANRSTFQPTAAAIVNGDDTLLTATAFEKTRPSPATLVLLLRGITKGESTARLARELGLSRKQLQTLRQRVQPNRNETAPTDLRAGTPCEADEL